MTQQTPQQAITAFLSSWQRRDHDELARWLNGSHGDPEQAQQAYRQEELRSFRILAARDTDPAATSIDVELLCRVQGELELKRRRYRMVHLDEAGRPIARHHPEGNWLPFVAYALPDPPHLRA